MSTASDSFLLFGVGMLNILAAILLAGVRARSENRQAAREVSQDLRAVSG